MEVLVQPASFRLSGPVVGRASVRMRKRPVLTVLFRASLLLLALGPSGFALAQESAWLDVNPRTRLILHDYYSLLSGSVRGIPPPNGCSADRGDLCFGGDHEDQFCTQSPGCQTDREKSDFLGRLRTAAETKPESAYAMGQAVYAFARMGRLIEAMEVAEACRAQSWWCEFLMGLVFQRSGQPEKAEDRFRRALQDADPNLACRVMHVGPLLSGGDRRTYEREDCSSRDSLNSHFWWLSDPFFTIAGNDRWTEHVFRRFELVIHEQLLLAIQSSHPGTHETRVVLRGFEDSWRPSPFRRYVSRGAARYHFVPESGLFNASFSELRYDLDAGSSDEGFSPVYGPVSQLPLQVARFRKGDSVTVALAGTLDRSALEEASDAVGHLILSDGPRSFPLQISSESSGSRAVFLAQVPPKPFVASYEVLSRLGLGRQRTILEPLIVQGPGVSDLLLFEPRGQLLPDSILTAAGMMLGETSVEAGDLLGIYWEAYEAAVGAPITLELEVRREGGGLIDSIRRLIPGVGEGDRGRMRWTEESSGSVFRKAVVVDLGGLDRGRYLLVVHTLWPGQEALGVERAFEVR